MERRQYDREYMEVAVDEMLRSRSEHIAKPDPLVGVAIADRDGKLLGSTHRGRLRVGAHAEYQLIDRDLHARDLEGATAYVTLEPCTARGEGKTPCADRMVDARISRVFIGMVDPNPAITGKGIQRLHSAGVEVGFFDSDLRNAVQEANRDFVAYCEKTCGDGDEDELGKPSQIENEVIASADVSDLSEDSVSEYLARKGTDFAFPSEEALDLLVHSGLLVRADSDSTYRPTVAGLLLLGRDPATFLPQSAVLLEALIGGRTVYDEASGSLVEVITSVAGFLDRHMRHFTEIRDLKRESIPEYPAPVLREGIVNALAHRSYQEGARVHVKLLSDRLEIWSPGLPVYPITLARLNALDAVPFSRNPRIANALNLLGYMDERGSGIGRMRELLAAGGLGGPTYEFDSGYTVLGIYGRGEAHAAVRLTEEQLSGLSSNALRILEHLLQKRPQRVTTPECADLLEVSSRYARQFLRELREAGIVEQRGAASKTFYTPITD